MTSEVTTSDESFYPNWRIQLDDARAKAESIGPMTTEIDLRGKKLTSNILTLEKVSVCCNFLKLKLAIPDDARVNFESI